MFHSEYPINYSSRTLHFALSDKVALIMDQAGSPEVGSCLGPPEAAQPGL
jgi:hypothetical protein